MTGPVTERSAPNLDHVVVRGFLWTSGGRLLAQMGTWVISLIIARLLAPRDYGIAAMASLYIGFAQLLAELGIGAAIVQRQDIDRRIVASLTGVSLLTGIILAVVSVPVGFGLSVFNREPVLTWVVAIYGLNFIPAAFKSVSIALLNRALAFDRITKLSLIEALTASLTSLVLALLGFSFWSLVIGNSIAGCVSALVAVLWANPGFSLDFDLARRSGSLHFGTKILISRVTWYVYAATDFLIIGRRLGTSTLGHYSLAYQFASVPADRVTGALTQVLFPVMSSLQANAAQLGRYFRNALEACALVLMPAYIGLALVAHDLIALALGPKWQETASILAVLAVAAVVRSLTGIANTVLVSAGNARLPATLSVIGLCVFPPAFFLASSHGATAVAAVWLLLYPFVLAIPTFREALRLTGMQSRELVRLLGPFAAATAVMAGVVVAVQMGLAHGPLAARLPLTIAAGAASYLAVMALVWPERLRRYGSLVTRVILPKKLKPAVAVS